MNNFKERLNSYQAEIKQVHPFVVEVQSIVRRYFEAHDKYQDCDYNMLSGQYSNTVQDIEIDTISAEPIVWVNPSLSIGIKFFTNTEQALLEFEEECRSRAEMDRASREEYERLRKKFEE